MARSLALLAALVLLALVGPTHAGAQDATPPTGSGEAPGPEECRVEPRPTEELIALWFRADVAGTPVVAPAEPAVMASVPAPLGEPADAATAAGVTAAVREGLACFNAGDFGRAMALFSDDLVRRFGPEPGSTPADVGAFLGAPAPVPADRRTRLIAVTDVAVLADGRTGAFVVGDDPTSPRAGPETLLFLFVEEGGRWLVDGVVEFTAVEDGDVGTPAP